MTRNSSINNFSNFTGVYCFGFQRQEQDDELWEGSVTFKYRVEDPRLGRFFSVDPLQAKYPWNSPFAFSENSTISFLELEGLEKISIHVRSFAPFQLFGGNNWMGDNRGFTTSDNVSSRLRQITHINILTQKFSTDHYGSVSIGGVGFPPSTWEPRPISSQSESQCDCQSGVGKDIFTHLHGNDDAIFYGLDDTPLEDLQSPEINVKTNIHYGFKREANTFNGETFYNLVYIQGTMFGDGFPSAEAFVEDAKGNRVFLGVAPTEYGPNEGPFIALWGGATEGMMEFDAEILMDSEFNFVGIKKYMDSHGNFEIVGINEWNKRFEETAPTGENKHN